MVHSTGQFGSGSVRGASMARAMVVAQGGASFGGAVSMASPKLRRLICPFCGGLTADSGRCDRCHARFDPLSRQATQNEMGPWYVRDESNPFRPGCNYSTIKRLTESGGIQMNSVLRGPSTRQFWMLAKHTPGVAQLLGVCHNCGGTVDPGAFACGHCQETFSADRDRQHLGLGQARALPGKAGAEVLAVRAEPLAGAELVSGPAAIPLIPREVSSGARVGTGRRAGEGEDGGGATSGEEGLEAIRRIDELSRAVRTLRRAWVAERKRAWVSVVCAGAVTALALILILVT